MHDGGPAPVILVASVIPPECSEYRSDGMERCGYRYEVKVLVGGWITRGSVVIVVLAATRYICKCTHIKISIALTLLSKGPKSYVP